MAKNVEPVMWGSPNFTFSDPPPYRSWPYEMTRLERLAHRAGMSDEELRLRLIEEIERRRGNRTTATW